MVTIVCEELANQPDMSVTETPSATVVKTYIVVPIGYSRLLDIDVNKINGLTTTNGTVVNAHDISVEEIAKTSDNKKSVPTLLVDGLPSMVLPLSKGISGMYGGGYVDREAMRETLHSFIDRFIDGVMENDSEVPITYVATKSEKLSSLLYSIGCSVYDAIKRDKMNIRMKKLHRKQKSKNKRKRKRIGL